MDALIPEAEDDPAAWLADIAGRAEVVETLCGTGSMTWHAWGSGEPLVLLHGGHGSWNHWCRNVEAFAASGYRVLAADLPGLGDSSDPGPPYTADGIAEIVQYGINRLVGRDRPYHIIGFSFGAVIGSVIAESAGTMVASFNMVGAAGFGPRRRSPNAMVKLQPDMEATERVAAARNNMQWLMLANPDNVGSLAIHMQLINSDRARTLSRPISMTPRLLEALPGITAPIGAIWGSQDRTVLDDLDLRIAMLRDECPDAKVEIIEGAGHWAQFEAAATCNRLFLDMLRR